MTGSRRVVGGVEGWAHYLVELNTKTVREGAEGTEQVGAISMVTKRMGKLVLQEFFASG